VEVVGDQPEVEAGLLGELRVVDEVVRKVLLGGERVSDLGHGDRTTASPRP
jgi:hypothetical protein